MGVLQDFERRLEGAVEGVFARMFRSGLQPIELAKGLQRYARDTQHVSHDGVVVPNVYRFAINTKDHERIKRLGLDLAAELSSVVIGTAGERGWILRGPVAVRVEIGEKVPVGRYELTGRVEPVAAPATATPPETTPAATPVADPTPAARPVTPSADHTQVLRPDAAVPDAADPTPATRPIPRLRVVDGGTPAVVELAGRIVAGRSPRCAIILTDTTVSREHAAFVRRADAWWVVDLGSTNGTKVNGTSAAEHPLREGDRVMLGEASLDYLEA